MTVDRLQMTEPLRIGRYTITLIGVRAGEKPPYRTERQVFVAHESGEGMGVSIAKFEKFFDELWKDF